MALTLDELKKLVEGEDLKYFIDPHRPALLLGVQGMCGRYQFVIYLDMDGRFLQMRTIGYMSCPADHEHLTAVLKVMSTTNYRVRLVKYGWDPGDGEIVAYADVWLMDGTLSQAQFQRILANYMPTIDFTYARLKKTMETGEDPGEMSVLSGVFDELGGGLPKELRDLLEGIGGEKKEPDEPVTL